MPRDLRYLAAKASICNNSSLLCSPLACPHELREWGVMPSKPQPWLKVTNTPILGQRFLLPRCYSRHKLRPNCKAAGMNHFCHHWNRGWKGTVSLPPDSPIQAQTTEEATKSQSLSTLFGWSNDNTMKCQVRDRAWLKQTASNPSKRLLRLALCLDSKEAHPISLLDSIWLTSCGDDSKNKTWASPQSGPLKI
jgi:hypothetical protein